MTDYDYDKDMGYRINLPIFDGPFDLLLYLIKVNEMDIYDISISTITAQYLDYIQMLKELNLDVAGDFLVMAATLIRIKARQLLPTTSDEDTEGEIDEILSARDLISQLIEYRKIKEMAGQLQDRQSVFSRVFFRTDKKGLAGIPEEEEEEDEDKKQLQIDLQTLFYAFSRVLPYVEMSSLTHMIPERFTVAGRIDNLRDILQVKRTLVFKDIIRTITTREELIVTFLALMEMCRRREIMVAQTDIFGDISIELRPPEDMLPLEDIPETDEYGGKEPDPGDLDSQDDITDESDAHLGEENNDPVEPGDDTGPQNKTLPEQAD